MVKIDYLKLQNRLNNDKEELKAQYKDVFENAYFDIYPHYEIGGRVIKCFDVSFSSLRTSDKTLVQQSIMVLQNLCLLKELYEDLYKGVRVTFGSEK